MNEQIIKLVFPKNLSKLAGNSYGKMIFEEQVKETIDYCELPKAKALGLLVSRAIT